MENTQSLANIPLLTGLVNQINDNIDRIFEEANSVSAKISFLHNTPVNGEANSPDKVPNSSDLTSSLSQINDRLKMLHNLCIQNKVRLHELI